MVAARLPFASLNSLAFGWLGQSARVSSLRCRPVQAPPLTLCAGNATCSPQFVTRTAAYAANFASEMVAVAANSVAVLPALSSCR